VPYIRPGQRDPLGYEYEDRLLKEQIPWSFQIEHQVYFNFMVNLLIFRPIPGLTL
jgi:hypothetical protein